jgi:Resolvase, N terminal domain/Helix-turn-helix domain of resolvase
VQWLLASRIDTDARARHRADEKIEDARLRLIRELERIAYSDARDLAQWDRRPRLDDEGNLVEFVDELQVTPSRLLSRDAAALVRSVTTKSGAIKIETHDKLQALDKLARILGVYQEPPAAAPSPVTVNQVNLGGDNALEVARRLAFALEVLVVTRLDRLARSTRDLLNTLGTVAEKGAGFRSLGDTWADTTTAHGRLMLTVLGGLAEFERELIRARTGEGRERAKARGVKMGRRPKLTPHQQREAIKRRDAGEETFREIAASYNVSAATISRLTA